MYTFDWDENKNQINQKKHGIDFSEACSVFFDENSMTQNIQRMRKGFFYWE